MENILSNFVSNVLLVYGVKIIGAIVLIIVGFAIVNWIKKKLTKGKLLKNLDVTTLTPIEALNELYNLQKKAELN